MTWLRELLEFVVGAALERWLPRWLRYALLALGAGVGCALFPRAPVAIQDLLAGIWGSLTVFTLLGRVLDDTARSERDTPWARVGFVLFFSAFALLTVVAFRYQPGAPIDLPMPIVYAVGFTALGSIATALRRRPSRSRADAAQAHAVRYLAGTVAYFGMGLVILVFILLRSTDWLLLAPRAMSAHVAAWAAVMIATEALRTRR